MRVSDRRHRFTRTRLLRPDASALDLLIFLVRQRCFIHEKSHNSLILWSFTVFSSRELIACINYFKVQIVYMLAIFHTSQSWGFRSLVLFRAGISFDMWFRSLCLEAHETKKTRFSIVFGLLMLDNFPLSLTVSSSGPWRNIWKWTFISAEDICSSFVVLPTAVIAVASNLQQLAKSPPTDFCTGSLLSTSFLCILSCSQSVGECSFYQKLRARNGYRYIRCWGLVMVIDGSFCCLVHSSAVWRFDSLRQEFWIWSNL